MGEPIKPAADTLNAVTFSPGSTKNSCGWGHVRDHGEPLEACRAAIPYKKQVTREYLRSQDNGGALRADPE
jgi:hypothetical protein